MDEGSVAYQLWWVENLGGIKYPVAATMLSNAYDGTGKEITYDENDIVGSTMKDDDYFKEMIRKGFKKDLADKDGNYNSEDDIKLDFKNHNDDLFYALGHANATINNAVLEDNIWHLTVTVSDKYDFDKWDDTGTMGLSGAYLNNIGLAGQYYGIIEPYDFSINLTVNIPAS